MYLDIRGEIETTCNTKKVTSRNYELFWEGIVFLPGVDEGESSIKALLVTLGCDATESDLLNGIKDLRGNWVIFVYDRAQARWLACSDHSHQSFMFFTKKSISNSFLRLRAEVADKTKLEEDSLVSFLYSGYCYTEKLFYADISKLDYHDYIVLDNTGMMVKGKKLCDVFSIERNHGGFAETLGRLFTSFLKHKVCIDLSGGTDSRAIILSLDHHGFDFDVATYGDQGFSEVKIARKVAKGLGRKLKFGRLSEEQIDSEDLKLAWIACDGLSLKLDSYLFETWRKLFKYSVVVSGTAGELYKDGG
jgi:asparagine synthetase B (glutamine-hydrolysing)